MAPCQHAGRLSTCPAHDGRRVALAAGRDGMRTHQAPPWRCRVREAAGTSGSRGKSAPHSGSHCGPLASRRPTGSSRDILPKQRALSASSSGHRLHLENPSPHWRFRKTEAKQSCTASKNSDAATSGIDIVREKNGLAGPGIELMGAREGRRESGAASTAERTAGTPRGHLDGADGASLGAAAPDSTESSAPLIVLPGGWVLRRFGRPLTSGTSSTQ